MGIRSTALMIPAHKNLTHPPGQIVNPVGEEYKPETRKGLYLRDVIKRIQGEEATQPSTSAETRLNSLVGALLKACSAVEENETLYKGIPTIRTSLIRKIIKENTCGL